MSLFRRLSLPLWPSLLVLALLALTLNLGFWQLRREAEKRELEAANAAAAEAAPVALATALAAAQPNRFRVQVSGEWQAAPRYLLENQSWQGRRGVHVLQWLRLPDGTALLVDRGWAVEPQAPLSGVTSITGQLYAPGKPWRAPVLDASSAEIRLPVLDLALLRSTDAQRLPYLLRLDATAAGALQPNWRLTGGMTAAKHRGYAVTWFSLSTVLVLLFFWWLYKTRSSQHD